MKKEVAPLLQHFKFLLVHCPHSWISGGCEDGSLKCWCRLLVPEGAIQTLFSNNCGCGFQPVRQHLEGPAQGLAIVLPDLEYSQGQGGFLEDVCRQYTKAKHRHSSLGQGFIVKTMDRSKWLRKEICERIRTFKSSLLCSIIKEAMYMPRAGHMLRKGLREP